MAIRKPPAGSCKIDQVKGRGAWIRITALQPGQDDVSVGDIAPVPNLLLLRTSSKDIYPTPCKNLEADYVIGQ